jgi:alpha-amylase/alpha-mannosidase (GH57 family)
VKKLSLAIYWHMHQPVYEIEGTYLMPWARLHAVKDYLDMVLILEKYPKLKLNFDVVPALMDTIIDYINGYHDIHSELTVSDVSKMSNEEKSFVLNNFFSPKFETMLYRSENYKDLYQKRFANESCSIEDFSEQEISDLMALFNLVWIDSIHFERYPKLKELWDKQYNYTFEDRVEIINIHRDIMREIIPTYKKYVTKGRIEMTTSPYYHAILPILADVKASSKKVTTTEGLPQALGMFDDAIVQVKKALDRVEEVMGIRPKGFWPPELCLGPKSLNLLAKEGIEWTISDEGILSNSINFDFVRDFKGNLTDPYHLLKVYEYQTKSDKPINIIFRDRSIPNLINFEYAGIDSKMAASDLYDKIKVIQNKLLVSPDDSHLLTIALDGENCWENYQNDGRDFLESIYSMIEKDDSLETVLITDYVRIDKHKKPLNKIHPGSWIDQTFQYWIGETTKNKAWSYVKNAKDDLNDFIKENKNHPNIEKAQRELFIAQGSDWFWWYGEPNNSGQDFVFDYMFREHLKNVYLLLGLESPEYLNEPLITKIDMPFKHPTRSITPRLDGKLESYDDWFHSGNISMLDGPVFRENKNVDKIHYGCDNENLYFRLHVNKNASESSFIDRINQFYIYTRNATNIGHRAYIRLISKTENQYPILREKFERELTLTLVRDTLYPARLTSCLHPNMWTLANPEKIKIVYNEVIDVAIPFEVLGIEEGETIELFMANTDSGVKNTYLPQEVLLSLTRA